jgi:glyoxylase-like metal-dependent hydrolase (beta-lactamase superfamily II)
MRVWSIEGNHQRLDGGAMYGNAPRALWERWTPPDELNRIDLACRGLLVEDLEGLCVLFEAGIGAFFRPELAARYGVLEPEHVLLRSLAARGIAHEQVDAVVLSHLHFDHAGGLLSAYRPDAGYELLFPRARYVIGEHAWARAKRPHPRDRASFIPELIALLEGSGRVDLVAGERMKLLADAVRFTYTNGHTPGLMHAEIADRIVFCSDLIPGRPWVHLPVTMGYDRYPERLIDEKRAFLEDKIARGIDLYFTHDSGCAVATPVRDEQGRFAVVDPRASIDGIAI